MKIPGSELVLAQEGRRREHVDRFHRRITDAKGKIVQNVRDIADIKLNGETAAELSKRPIAYDTGFALAPGTYTLKVPGARKRDRQDGHVTKRSSSFPI